MNIDELRDRLAAISMAIANQDDREAQAIIRTTLAALAEQADDKADAERWRHFLSTRPPDTHAVIIQAIDNDRGASHDHQTAADA